MIFSKKMLGSCCVGLALVLFGESFGAQSVEDIEVSYDSGKTKTIKKDVIIQSYNELKSGTEFAKANFGEKGLAVMVLSMINSGFENSKVEGYDESNKDGIIKLINDCQFFDVLNYYDSSMKLEDKFVALVHELEGQSATIETSFSGSKPKEDASLDELFSGFTSGKSANASSNTSSSNPDTLDEIFVKDVKKESSESGASSSDPFSELFGAPARAVSPTLNFGLSKSDFDGEVAKKLQGTLQQEWSTKATLTKVDDEVVEILFGGKRFLTTYAILEGASRHFNDPEMKGNHEAFVKLVDSFIKQNAALTEASKKADEASKKVKETETLLAAERKKHEGAPTAQQIEFFRALMNGLVNNQFFSNCSVASGTNTAILSFRIADVTAEEYGFEPFKTTPGTTVVTNPIKKEQVGVYNKEKFELLEKGKEGKYDTTTHGAYEKAKVTDEIVTGLTNGTHEAIEIDLLAAKLEREKMMSKVESLTEFSTVVAGINSGAEVFGVNQHAQDNARGQVDGLLAEIDKVTAVFGAINTATLKATDITVLNAIAGKLLTGNWSNIDDNTDGVEDAGLKRILDTAKTIVADNVNTAAVQHLVTAQFGSFGATDENSVRRALLIAVLAGKNADDIRGSIAD